MHGIQPWPEPIARAVDRALHQAAEHLQQLDARVERYQLADQPYPEQPFPARGTHRLVYSLEARMGPSPGRPGYTVYAYFQVHDPLHPTWPCYASWNATTAMASPHSTLIFRATPAPWTAQSATR